MRPENQDIAVSAEPTLRTAEIQNAIHAFIAADLLHRKVIDSWAASAGMHRSQHRMLLCLSKCDSTPSQKELAKKFDISPAAVAVTLKKLEGDGYIERGKCADCADFRCNEIKITDRGRQAAIQSKKYFQHVDSEAFKDFSNEELTIFTSLLERMTENLKSVEPLPAADGNSETH